MRGKRGGHRPHTGSTRTCIRDTHTRHAHTEILRFFSSKQTALNNCGVFRTNVGFVTVFYQTIERWYRLYRILCAGVRVRVRVQVMCVLERGGGEGESITH